MFAVLFILTLFLVGMAQYRSRETAAIAAADTAYPITGLGGATASNIVAPSGVSRIKEIIFAGGSDFAADAVGGCVWVTLGGEGIVGQDQVIMAFGQGGKTLIVGGIMPPTRIPVDILVNSGSPIEMNAYTNVDTGTAGLGVTLVFA